MKGKLNNKRKGRTEKGITLVALVVTVVVLLILAGVSVVTLFGESGIITAAQKARNLTESGVANDLAGLEDLTGLIETELAPTVEQGKKVDKGTKVAKYTDSTSSAPAYIPGGYCVVGDSTTDTDNVRKLNTIANGLVISDLAGDTLDNEPNSEGVRGNQFVWVPVPEIASMYDATNKAGKLYDYGKYNSITETWKALSVPTPKTYPTTKNDGCREPDVVTGASKGSDSWTGTNYDAVEANLNVITDFTVKTGEKKSAALFKTYLQKEFENMIASVKKYKGFYIGRYETGNLSQTKAVVQKGNNYISNVTWYNQYQKTKNMTADNSNVTTSIIWGCQWDRTLNWLIETPNNDIEIEDIVDSHKWGNYSDNTEEGHGSKRSSGYNITWQKNHIYDMAGNVDDWTMEAFYTISRVARGGFFGGHGSVSGHPASYRNGAFEPDGVSSSLRFSFHTLRKSVNWFEQLEQKV